MLAPGMPGDLNTRPGFFTGDACAGDDFVSLDSSGFAGAGAGDGAITPRFWPSFDQKSPAPELDMATGGRVLARSCRSEFDQSRGMGC